MSDELTYASQIPLQQVRKILEEDFGKGCEATMIVRNEKGDIVLFVSGGSAKEIEEAIGRYRINLGLGS